MENPTNVLDAYEVGARHSLTHWGSNHEQGTPGPCPPWSPSLVEMIRCYKRCCEEEVLRVIVAKPNLGLLTHMQLSQSTAQGVVKESAAFIASAKQGVQGS